MFSMVNRVKNFLKEQSLEAECPFSGVIFSASKKRIVPREGLGLQPGYGDVRQPIVELPSASGVIFSVPKKRIVPREGLGLQPGLGDVRQPFVELPSVGLRRLDDILRCYKPG